MHAFGFFAWCSLSIWTYRASGLLSHTPITITVYLMPLSSVRKLFRGRLYRKFDIVQVLYGVRDFIVIQERKSTDLWMAFININSGHVLGGTKAHSTKAHSTQQEHSLSTANTVRFHGNCIQLPVGFLNLLSSPCWHLVIAIASCNQASRQSTARRHWRWAQQSRFQPCDPHRSSPDPLAAWTWLGVSLWQWHQEL